MGILAGMPAAISGINEVGVCIGSVSFIVV
jgi:hypothetical protein